MAALISKPGLTGASALSIPTDWSEKWFRGFINNMLKGGDVRNAIPGPGVSITGNISSPYATIGIGGSVPATIGPPSPPGFALKIVGNSGVPFLGNTHLGLQISGATGTTDYSGIDFSSTNTNPQARIGAVFAGGGSSLVFGTSNNYGTGITNQALTIGPTGTVTIAAPTTGVVSLAANSRSTTVRLPQDFDVSSSNGDYPIAGYNLTATAVAGTYNYTVTDSSSAIGYQAGQLFFKVAASGTSGNAITYFNVVTIDNNGNTIINPRAQGSGIVLQLQPFTSAQVGLSILDPGANATQFRVSTTNSAINIQSAGGTATLNLLQGAVTAIQLATGGVNTFTGANTFNSAAASTCVTINAADTTHFACAINANGVNTVAVLYVNGNSAGVEALRLDTTATTGAQTPAGLGAVKPGAAATSASKWIPINLDGVRMYVPAWL